MNTAKISRDLIEMKKKIDNCQVDTLDNSNNDVTINYVIKRFIEIMSPPTNHRDN